MKIIYHLPNQKGRSFFDINISNLIKKEKIKIACPYISINYFEDVIIKLSSDFQLLTDINALIKSKNTKKEIEDSCKLLMKYKEKIKHCDSIHAKCIISSKNVFLGSANFTDSAINKKNELSIIIDTQEEIKEINKWFDSWWDESKTLTDLDFENILSYSKNKIDSPITPNIMLSKTSINCHYDLYSDKKSDLVTQKNEEYLINFLKHNKDISFINSYCDLAKKVIEKFDIQDDDPRLCISFREDNYRIPITIGQRYIMNYNYLGTNENFSLIMNINDQYDDYTKDGLIRVTYFQKKNKDDVPYFRFKKDLNNLIFDDKTIKQWENAVENELKRCKKSSYKKHHQSILYKFITDINFRKRIISEI